MGHNSATGLLLLLVHAKRLSSSLNRVLMNCAPVLQYMEPTVSTVRDIAMKAMLAMFRGDRGPISMKKENMHLGETGTHMN